MGDTQLQDSVIRCFEIIGEATKSIPAHYREEHPEIPWNKMAGTRDVLIHEYAGVDIELVWNTAKENLPELKEYMEQLLASYTDATSE